MTNNLLFDIDNYHNVFHKYPKCLMESEGRVYGSFWIGNTYSRKFGYYGEYPPSYVDRIKALFPNRFPILHVFGGTVMPSPDEHTVDINPKMNPSICCDATDIHNHTDIKYPLILCDPPYTKSDAKKYGFPLPHKKLVLRSLRKVAQEDTVLVWLDITVPIYRKIEWDMLGMISLFTGTNRLVRAITIFKASDDNYYKENYK